MPLNLARRRGGILRILPVNGAFARPVRVLSSQQYIKRISVARRPLPTLATPVSPLSSSILRNLVRGYATRGRPPKATTTPASTKRASITLRKSAAKKPAKKKKELTEEQKEKKQERKEKKREREKEKQKKVKARQLLKDLKVAALEPPKRLPVSPWALAVAHKVPEAQKVAEKPTDVFKVAMEAARKMSAEERQRYAEQAKANFSANKSALEAWIKSYTPLEIVKANQARHRIAQITKKPLKPLHDDRAVKRPTSSWIYFFLEAQERDGVQNTSVSELSRRYAPEWKNLSKSEREKYEQLAEASMDRYVREHTEVYGYAPVAVQQRDF
ncbi:hypothetical protein BDV12DRAFT_197391 [Aspergillus spectabilis]